MSFTIITHVYNQYELLRQLIESIKTNVDSATYDEIIIVDDYSDTKGRLREYENYLIDAYDDITMINFSESRPSVYMLSDAFNYKHLINFSSFDNPKKANMGPVMATKLGLMNTRTAFALKVDTDIIFLKKAKMLLSELTVCFKRFPRAMCIGQLMGIKSKDIIEIDESFDPPNRPHEAYKDRGGYPGPMAYACRMVGFHYNDLLMMHPSYPREDERIIQGWEHREYIADIFRKGFSTCNFPLYSEKYLAHVGGASCLNMGKGNMARWQLGFTKDFKTRYGGRNTADSLWDWYSGCHMIDMTAREYGEYLERTYAADFHETRLGIEDKLIPLFKEGNDND